MVTEHNLDVLSVLNHALREEAQLWPGLEGTERKTRRAWLKAWRDELRTGIFELLWESPKEGHTEMKPPNGCRSEPKTIVQQGRVITGGTFEDDGRFLPSQEVAIDNCSWLALSVDYGSLPSHRVNQLQTCLEYTLNKFADDIPYGASDQCYYGTHYFPSSFRDPYIEQSDLQERVYHLEATAGLILGLFRFAQAHPNHGAAFETEAYTLWAGVQSFVHDHGFLYASERIQDLFASLPSSTAAIWYLDVYDALEGPGVDEDRSLEASVAWFTPAFAETEVAQDSLGTWGPTLWAAGPNASGFLVAGLELAKQIGAKEAFKLFVFNIMNGLAMSGIVGTMNREEIEALADHVFVDERHNVLVVDEGVPFLVPPDYALVGWAADVPFEHRASLYHWPRDAIAEHPSWWGEALSLSVVDTLGFGVRPEARAEAAQAIRAWVQGYVPQNVILKRTGDGVEIYRKLNLDLGWEAPRGIVLHLGPDEPTPRLIHRQPGSWSTWYEDHVLTNQLSDAHREAYIRAINDWLLDNLLARPERLSFKEQSEAAKRRITGQDPTSTSVTTPNTPPPPGGPTGGLGDDTITWRKKQVRWVDPGPELVTEGLWSLVFSSTDGLLVENADQIRAHATTLSHARVRRFYKGRELTDEAQYPSGISEWKVKNIFRSQPVGALDAHQGTTDLEREMDALVRTGLNLGRPLRLYPLPSGRVAIHPDDHVTLAAFNLLKQDSVPVRLGLPPYEWSEAQNGNRAPEQRPRTPTGATPAALKNAEQQVYQTTFLEFKSAPKELFKNVGLMADGSNSSLWAHLWKESSSAWIHSTHDVSTLGWATGQSVDKTIFLVQPEGGLNLNVALGHDFKNGAVVFPTVSSNNVLGAFVPKSTDFEDIDAGTFTINETAHQRLPWAYGLATGLAQLDLWDLEVLTAPETAVASLVRELHEAKKFVPPLLVVHRPDGGRSVLSSPLEVHALRELGVRTTPALIISWAKLNAPDKKQLKAAYGLDAEGRLLGFRQELHINPESALFPQEKEPIKIIAFNPVRGFLGSRTSAAVIDDFSQGGSTLQPLPKGASQGLKHAHVLWNEFSRQATNEGLDRHRARVLGLDVGPAEKTTPNDVVRAIRRSIQERRSSVFGPGKYTVVVISISPQLRYDLEAAFPSADRQRLAALKKQLHQTLSEAIADAGRAQMLVFAGAAPGASLSEAIVEAGQGQDHFFVVAGTEKMIPGKRTVPKTSVPAHTDFLAPGRAPLLTQDGVVIAKEDYVPLALSSAAAIVSHVKFFSMERSFDMVPSIIRQTLVPIFGSAEEIKHLSPEHLHRVTRMVREDHVSLGPAVRNTDPTSFGGRVHSTVSVDQAVVIQDPGSLSVQIFSSMKDIVVKDGGEIALFLDGNLQGIVAGSVWNQALRNGDIRIRSGSPDKLTYFGGRALHEAGQKLRFLDHDAKREDTEDGPWITTDAIVASEYKSLITHRDEALKNMGRPRVRRHRGNQEVAPNNYPKGVFEVDIKTLFRTQGVHADKSTVRDTPSVKAWLSTLTKDGLDVDNPVHVSLLGDRLLVWPSDHDLLAALNLLQESKVPVRLVPHFEGWHVDFVGRNPQSNPETPYGISKSVLDAIQPQVTQAHYIEGPSDPQTAFQAGIQAEGTDPDLLRHIWNTGANSAWVTGYDDLPFERVFKEPKFKDPPITVYLVRFRGGLTLSEEPRVVGGSETAVPSIRARDVLAAVTWSGKKTSWIINPHAERPLPDFAQWTDRTTTYQLLDGLDLTAYDRSEVSMLTNAVVEDNLVLEPLVVLKKDRDTYLLAGKERAVALRSLGQTSMSALILDWARLSVDQKSDLVRAFPEVGAVSSKPTPDEGPSEAFTEEPPSIPKAPRLGPSHTIGNKVRIRFDESLAPQYKLGFSGDILLVSTPDVSLLASNLGSGTFFGDFTEVLRALGKKPGLFSIDVLDHRSRSGNVDLSDMLRPHNPWYPTFRKRFGANAFPGPPAGWKRHIAYLFMGQEGGRVSNTVEFTPKTVSVPVTLLPPKIGPSGDWQNFDVHFSYYEDNYDPLDAELYFAKVSSTNVAQGPIDFIVFDLRSLRRGASSSQHNIPVGTRQKSVRDNLSLPKFVQSIQATDAFDLWVSVRFRAYGWGIHLLGPSRESQPIKVDLKQWPFGSLLRP